ncbi:MAG TPA: cysteine--tRNA ligase [Alphaproteobacteria bacterium]
MTKLSFYNTRTRQKEEFTPLDPKRVTLYACGPTVYNYIHIGNARMNTVFDTLFRLLRHVYGEKNVVYARNLTDVDDKIINAAREQNAPIHEITEKYTQAFWDDTAGLNSLSPTHQPKATDYIPQMIAMIASLVEQGHAYAADGHVLFAVTSYDDYGKLSRHSRDELIAGARVEVAPYKKDPADFVLWKPSTDDQPGWDSPWGFGRPGWHIECSAMATDILGKSFDIHGGGNDLIFPHHENEIAQSCCAYKGDSFARVWMHNGMLNINEEKMSKSLGNFFTLHEILDKHPGEAVRYLLLSAYYRQPLEFNLDLLTEAKQIMDRWYRAVEKAPDAPATQPHPDVMEALSDDLNTAKAYTVLHDLVLQINKTDDQAALKSLVGTLKASANLLGLLEKTPQDWFQGVDNESAKAIDDLIAERNAARAAKDFATSDRIRNQLLEQGIILDDTANGTTWRRS